MSRRSSTARHAKNLADMYALRTQGRGEDMESILPTAHTETCKFVHSYFYWHLYYRHLYYYY